MRKSRKVLIFILFASACADSEEAIPCVVHDACDISLEFCDKSDNLIGEWSTSEGICEKQELSCASTYDCPIGTACVDRGNGISGCEPSFACDPIDNSFVFNLCREACEFDNECEGRDDECWVKCSESINGGWSTSTHDSDKERYLRYQCELEKKFCEDGALVDSSGRPWDEEGAGQCAYNSSNKVYCECKNTGSDSNTSFDCNYIAEI